MLFGTNYHKMYGQVKWNIKDGKFCNPQLCPAFGLSPMGDRKLMYIRNLNKTNKKKKKKFILKRQNK